LVPLRRLEQLLAAGVYLQAKREADRLLLMDDLDLRMRGWAERGACVASLHLHQYYAAAKHGERALNLAEQAGDPDLMARAHYDLGVVYVHIGDSRLAEEHLRTFLAMADQLESDRERHVAVAYYNLSRVFRQRRNHADAIAELKRAGALFQQIGNRWLAVRCHQDIAWCVLMDKQPDEATPHLAEMEAYLQEHADDGLAADLLCEQALWHQLKGNVATSMVLCEEVFQPGRAGVSDHHMAEAAWIMGENMLLVGHFQEAQVFANMALEHAVKDGWPLGMNLACDLRRRLLEQTIPGA
jgi:tetratricopeptide (TPR) repeat protein